ncbi:MAG: hypothetical protein MJ249_16010 [Kiritimatiellae bacterium]|nr:hypothetical protein [Kiritimatiellia bacterium]
MKFKGKWRQTYNEFGGQYDAKPVLFATAKDNSRTYKTRIVALTKE